MRPICAADFETHRIGPRPKEYPPKPVGLALYGDGVPAQYLSWGHPSGNNSSPAEAKGKLRKLYQSHRMVFHNAPFDCEVAHVHLDLLFVPEEYDDTLFLGFLIDPRSKELGLKPLSEKFLGIKPKERDRLRTWILANIKQAKEKDWGAYISQAPAGLVDPYARGDVTRTYKLFKALSKKLDAMDRQYPPEEGQQSMRQAYQREIKLMPAIMKMERAGIPIDIKNLSRDLPLWEKSQKNLGNFIIKKLGGKKAVSKFSKKGEEFNLGSNNQLANAMEEAGKVSSWTLTAKGNKSTARKSLEGSVSDAKLLEALQRWSILDTYLNTYGKKWLNDNVNGFVYPKINQVRNYERENGVAGTRTGRLSYSDSWQAIPSISRLKFKDLPKLRNYIVPKNKGQVIAVRDYSQQEFRILAHYEAGPLLARYQEDPTIDNHEEARRMVYDLTGVLHDRLPIKTIGFGQIYGMGLEALAAQTKLPMEETRALKKAYLKAIPGLPLLNAEIRSRCQRGEPIRTWGGRLYWVEPPAFSKKFNKVMSFEYKMLNILIQGSAADNTKEAMIRADAALPTYSELFLQVHDELGIITPMSYLNKGMKILRESMESVEFDVLMLTDGKWSPKSWGAVKTYKDKR